MVKLLLLAAAAYFCIQIARAIGLARRPTGKGTSGQNQAVDKSRAVDAEFEDI